MELVDDAIENFSIVLELDYTHVNALLARGACLNKKKEFKAALHDYEVALEMDSEKSLIRNSGAQNKRILRKIGSENELVMVPQSENNYNSYKLIQIDTSVGNGGQNPTLELVRVGSGSNTNSSVNLRKAGSMKEDSSFQEINVGNMQNVVRDGGNGGVQLKKIKEADHYHNQGWEARKRMDFKKAIEFYTKAITIDPLYFKAYLNRGFAYDKIG